MVYAEAVNNQKIITSNDHAFSRPIIYTDTNSQCYFIHRHLSNSSHNNAYSMMRTLCLMIIVSNVYQFIPLSCKGPKLILFLLIIEFNLRWSHHSQQQGLPLKILISGESWMCLIRLMKRKKWNRDHRVARRLGEVNCWTTRTSRRRKGGAEREWPPNLRFDQSEYTTNYIKYLT